MAGVTYEVDVDAEANPALPVELLEALGVREFGAKAPTFRRGECCKWCEEWTDDSHRDYETGAGA